MLLKLVRIVHFEDCTLGQLFINHPSQSMDFLECFTLEDPVREQGVKVQNKTAIPAGRYRVVIDWSNRFKRMMPHILDVPNFTGIRIHAGNTAEDTSGCILVGGAIDQKNHVIKPGTSRPAYDRLFKKLEGVMDIHIWVDMGFDFPKET